MGRGWGSCALDCPIERLLPKTEAILPATAGPLKLAALTVLVELFVVPAGKMTGAEAGGVESATVLPPPVSMVTAPLMARARPSMVAPVRTETETAARMLPWKTAVVPIVAELPTCQKIFEALAAPARMIWRPDVMVR